MTSLLCEPLLPVRYVLLVAALGACSDLPEEAAPSQNAAATAESIEKLVHDTNEKLDQIYATLDGIVNEE